MNDVASPLLLSPEDLMDFAGTLRQLTLVERHHSQIPEFIARVLGLPSLCFAIVRYNQDETESVVTLAQYCSPNARLHTQRAYLPSEILEWARSDSVELPESGCSDRSCSCRNVLIRHAADLSHSLLIVYCEHRPNHVLTQEARTILELAARYIGKSFKAMFECETQPHILGKRFKVLTRTEWRVLRAMDSDDSEKQLAARLDMSLHALHAHVKAIYRKLGVNGRLQAMQVANEAYHKYYIQNMHDQYIQSRIDVA
jgi:DNA-binding NarL/FixJ family response regulator